MKTAILVTTYNWPSALKWVLLSITQQARLPDEVVVADDGSTEATRVCCKQFMDHLPIRHIWQPDGGFRAARVRNLAMSSIHSDHVIMIDGDCLLPPDFVANHRQLIQPGRLVSGGRLLVSPRETAALLSQEPLHQKLKFNEQKFKRWPLGPLRDLSQRNWRMVRTCNLGVLMSDVLNVGGFDERFVGWGLEDSDFVVRLLNAGIRIRNGRQAVSVKHLHHTEGKNHISERNIALFKETREARSSGKPIQSMFNHDVRDFGPLCRQDH